MLHANHPKNRLIILMIIVLFAAFGNTVSAQLSQPQPKFHNFTVESGLPSSETYFVYQDKSGYIWICTDHGVARYDGYKFHVFTTDDGLTDNVVFKIFEDYKGRLWFFTYNGLLCYFENGKIHPYKYNHVIEKIRGTNSTAERSIVIDSLDNVYYSIMCMTAFVIDAHGNSRILKEKKNASVNIMLLGKHEFLYSFRGPELTTPALLPLYLNGKNINQSILFGQEFKKTAIKSVGNTIYMITGNNVYNLNTKQKIYTTNAPITFYHDKENLWVGSLNAGAHLLEIKNGKVSHEEDYLQGYSVTSILKDSEGGYWFSTLENGVFYTPSLAVRNYTIAQHLIDNSITSINGIKNDIYLGYYVGRWQQLSPPYMRSDQPKATTHTIVGASKSKIYFSTHRTYAIDQGKIKEISQFWVRDIYSAGSSIILGQYDITQLNDDGSELLLYDGYKDTSLHRTYGYTSLMIDDVNNTWIGTIYGINKVTKNSISNESLKDPLFKVRVADLNFHPQWKCIAATKSEGIFFFYNDKVIRRLKKEDGLLSNQVNALFTESSGRIWVATNKGINCITKDPAGKIKIQSFNTLHGLISNEVSAIYVYDEKVWVGTKKGLSVIDLKVFQKNKAQQPVYLSYLETNEEKIEDFSRPIVFNYDKTYIKIGFRNTNYRTLNSGKFQYRFGKDEKWITSPIPEITLNKPVPGTYNFEVRYQNEDMLWSTPQLICSFTIDLPFYKKWYFIAGLIVFTGLVFYFIFRLRIKQLNQKHRLYTQINRLEQQALRAQMNPHFIFNALNSIQSFLVYEENEKAEKYLLKFAQLIRKTLHNSREQHITIKDEIEILEKYMDLERMRFRNKFSYAIHNEIGDDQPAIHIPNMLIQPFIENSILHGFSNIDADGKIDIWFLPDNDEQITCIVEDNGIGRKAAMAFSSGSHVSFATKITEERLKSFEQGKNTQFRIEITDLEDENGPTGTRVTINIPLIEK